MGLPPLLRLRCAGREAYQNWECGFYWRLATDFFFSVWSTMGPLVVKGEFRTQTLLSEHQKSSVKCHIPSRQGHTDTCA